MPILETANLEIGYSKGKSRIQVQSELNLQLHQGELVCLIGPNGSGKSTLLRTLSGLQQSLQGNILVAGNEITKINQNERSFLISMVLTDRIEIENTTVKQIIALGRQPYTTWWGNMSDEDNNRVADAIEMVHLQHKSNHFLNELSDGERQRVMIAKALAQDTPLFFLDEPTAHLDLPNRVDIMLLLHRLAHETNKAILLSTHELDMALQAGDKIWLLDSQTGLTSGVPEDLVLNGSFNKTFNSPNYYFNQANGNFSMNYPLKKEVTVTGDKTKMYWTLRALARAGYRVVSTSDVQIIITQDEWIINEMPVRDIESLIQKLKEIEEIRNNG